MTLNVDTTKAIRSYASYSDLVAAVRDAPPSTQETIALEWKSEAELADKSWQAELSRQVIAFANRDPDVAAPHFEGCAYVLVGVSPGSLKGTAYYDAATIDDWISPYVRHGREAPAWAASYVELDGVTVLILTIEPPRFGDPIWTCRKEYRGDLRAEPNAVKRPVRDGGVYVRHQAASVEADSADMDMLQRRLLANQRLIAGVSVTIASESAACAIDASDEAIEAWADRERTALRPPPPPPPASDATTVLGAAMVAQINKALTDLALSSQFWEPDARTPAQYQAEVDKYVARATKDMPAVMLRRAAELRLGRIVLSVANASHQPIKQLEIELTIVGGVVWAGNRPRDVPEAALPRRPVMLGEGGRSRLAALSGIGGYGGTDVSALLARGVVSARPTVFFDNAPGSCRLTFAPIDLYARKTAQLPEFYLIVSAADHGTATITATWIARGGEMAGTPEGSIEIPIAEHVPTIDDLLTGSAGALKGE